MDLIHAEILANCLLVKHGLRDYNFSFDNSKKRFGFWHYNKKSISLSKNLTLLNEEAHVKDCILHEIAHALAPKGAHHNHEWQKIALSIGAWCNKSVSL